MGNSCRTSLGIGARSVRPRGLTDTPPFAVTFAPLRSDDHSLPCPSVCANSGRCAGRRRRVNAPRAHSSSRKLRQTLLFSFVPTRPLDVQAPSYIFFLESATPAYLIVSSTMPRDRVFFCRVSHCLTQYYAGTFPFDRDYRATVDVFAGSKTDLIRTTRVIVGWQ